MCIHRRESLLPQRDHEADYNEAEENADAVRYVTHKIYRNSLIKTESISNGRHELDARPRLQNGLKFLERLAKRINN